MTIRTLLCLCFVATSLPATANAQFQTASNEIRHSQSLVVKVDPVQIRLIDEVEVPARAIGALSKVQVREGSYVEAGQLIALIDDTEAELANQRAQADLEIAAHLASDDVSVRSAEKKWAFAIADLGRLQRARESQPRSVSMSELEKAKLDTDQAELEVEKAKSELRSAAIRQKLAESDLSLAQRNLEVRKVFAPISGVVVSVKQKSGEWVQPGDAIFRIVRTDRLRAEGYVPAGSDASHLIGKRATLIPTAAGSTAEVYHGKVVFVSPENDPVTKQIKVWAEFPNAKGQLRPGLGATMTIAVQ